MTVLNMNITVTTTHRVLEQELRRLERFCEGTGTEKFLRFVVCDILAGSDGYRATRCSSPHFH